LDGFFPQTSTQWDGLRHVCTPTHFYNGRPQAEVLAPGSRTLGVQRLVNHGLVTRGVLLDVERHLSSQGKAIDYTNTPFEISADLLEQTARAQNVELRAGDVVLFRTGWLDWLRKAPRETREALAHALQAPGLQPDGDIPEYLWDRHVAAIATDTVAVERWPFDPPRGFMHFQLITFFGMTLGEMWWLDDLARDCHADGRWEFLLVSVPLHVPGGVGSPANAVAVK
jgi:kynurenine formamidase